MRWPLMAANGKTLLPATNFFHRSVSERFGSVDLSLIPVLLKALRYATI